MNSLIQWPRAKYWDRAWNPIIGCHPCSPACENCYAATLVKERFKQSFLPHATGKSSPPRKGVVFCGNMTDLFGEWVPLKVIFRMLSGMWHHPDPHGSPVPLPATYLWLTKRVDRMCEALSNYTQCPNAYFGFTAENQEWYERRLKDFRCVMPECGNGWLSIEPLLGPVDLGLRYIAPEDMPFKWIVVGCESGSGRRKCDIIWVESIVNECLSAGVPVFVKQLDIGGMCERDITKFPQHLQIRQMPFEEREAENGE